MFSDVCLTPESSLMSQYEVCSSLLNIPAVELICSEKIYMKFLSYSDFDAVDIAIVLISFTYHFIKCHEHAE